MCNSGQIGDSTIDIQYTHHHTTYQIYSATELMSVLVLEQIDNNINGAYLVHKHGVTTLQGDQHGLCIFAINL